MQTMTRPEVAETSKSDAKDPIARVYITQKNSGVSCRPAYDFDDLGRQVEAAYKRRLETVAYSTDAERRVVGKVETNINGVWVWWCETAELNRPRPTPVDFTNDPTIKQAPGRKSFKDWVIAEQERAGSGPDDSCWDAPEPNSPEPTPKPVTFNPIASARANAAMHRKNAENARLIAERFERSVELYDYGFLDEPDAKRYRARAEEDSRLADEAERKAAELELGELAQAFTLRADASHDAFGPHFPGHYPDEPESLPYWFDFIPSELDRSYVAALSGYGDSQLPDEVEMFTTTESAWREG